VDAHEDVTIVDVLLESEVLQLETKSTVSMRDIVLGLFYFNLKVFDTWYTYL